MLVKAQIARACISSEVPDDAHAAGPGATLRTTALGFNDVDTLGAQFSC